MSGFDESSLMMCYMSRLENNFLKFQIVLAERFCHGDEGE